MINKESSVPLYTQLVDILINEIETKMAPNDKMLSEREITEKYGLSRTTVRLAFSELENAGYIYRRHGKGTFVSTLNRQKKDLSDSYSFTEQMETAGKTPHTRLLNFEIIPANKYVSQKMGINVGDRVYRLDRLRLADEEPMMLEVSYLPLHIFPKLTKTLITSGPMYDLFRDVYHQTIKVADEEFSASIVDNEEAKLLDVQELTACLKIKRLTYNQANEIIEFTLSTARSDQFVYKIRHMK